jgi:hypothetical protein
MAFPTDTQLTSNTILRTQLSIGNRTLPTITVTVGTGGASSGATTIPVTALASPTGLTRSAGQILIQQGTSLTFNSTTPVTATLAADALVGDTSLTVVALSGALTAGNTATSSGLLQIIGGDSMDFQTNDKEVATRAFENGLFDDARKVMIGAAIPFNGFYRVGDPVPDLVIKPAVMSALEVYFYLLYPDTAKHYWSGWAYIKGYKEQNKLDDIRRMSFELRVVGTFTNGIGGS